MRTPAQLADRARARARGWVRRANVKLAPERAWLRPEWIVMGVNNACNLHCKMCDVGSGDLDTNFGWHLTGAEPRNMPLELAVRTIDQVAETWPKTRVGFAFTEPLAWRPLAEAVAHATARGVRTAVTTNGLLLPARADALVDAGLEDLYVSLDGPADVHDVIRGRAGSFDAALRGLERVAERGGTKISVFCTIVPWNLGRLADLVDALAHLPLQVLGYMHPNYTNAAMVQAHALSAARWPATESNLAHFDPATMDLAAVAESVEAARTRAAPFPRTFSPDLRSREAIDAFYRAPDVRFGRACSDVWRSLMVKSDGTVTPAHGRCYRVTAGSLWDTPLATLWNAESLGALRTDLAANGGLLPACTRCCSAFGQP